MYYFREKNKKLYLYIENFCTSEVSKIETKNKKQFYIYRKNFPFPFIINTLSCNHNLLIPNYLENKPNEILIDIPSEGNSILVYLELYADLIK